MHYGYALCLGDCLDGNEGPRRQYESSLSLGRVPDIHNSAGACFCVVAGIFALVGAFRMT
eukprot:6174693-Pleurochrysis_carterae.AAC.2